MNVIDSLPCFNDFLYLTCNRIAASPQWSRIRLHRKTFCMRNSWKILFWECVTSEYKAVLSFQTLGRPTRNAIVAQITNDSFHYACPFLPSIFLWIQSHPLCHRRSSVERHSNARRQLSNPWINIRESEGYFFAQIYNSTLQVNLIGSILFIH